MNDNFVQEKLLQERRLLEEYGGDTYDFGTVLLFLPHTKDTDRKTRAVVKTSATKWALSGWIGSYTWRSVLEKIGTGKLLQKVTGTQSLKITGHSAD